MIVPDNEILTTIAAGRCHVGPVKAISDSFDLDDDLAKRRLSANREQARRWSAVDDKVLLLPGTEQRRRALGY